MLTITSVPLNTNVPTLPVTALFSRADDHTFSFANTTATSFSLTGNHEFSSADTDTAAMPPSSPAMPPSKDTPPKINRAGIFAAFFVADFAVRMIVSFASGKCHCWLVLLPYGLAALIATLHATHLLKAQEEHMAHHKGFMATVGILIICAALTEGLACWAENVAQSAQLPPPATVLQVGPH